ncbi:M36 family metallopeptidase [Krasilnikovia sp. MM14-A1004]|uniref:M36 family metallopeptidase n=1 Tax=Krasilnikovia sp. MM14-A1004 TaxID=3373541 RepID=UPI00399C8B49
MKPLSAPSLNRRWGAAAAGVILFAGLLPAQADAAPKPKGAVGAADRTTQGEELANYDSRDTLNLPGAKPSIAAKAEGARVTAQRLTAAVKPGSPARKLRDQLGVQGIVDIDNATGTPRRVAKLDGFLTAASRKKPATIVRDYLKAHTDVFGLNAAAVDQLQLRKDYVDIAGTHHLSFVQRVAGVAVFGNGLKAHVAKNGSLVQVDGSPLPFLPTSAGTAKLTAEQARAAAVANVLGDSPATVVKRGAGATRATTFSDGGSAELVLFQTASGPRVAWQVYAKTAGWLHVVDAQDGTVLFRQSTVARDSALVWPNYPGAPVGGKQVKVDLRKWLPNNAPRLSGNVAHVTADLKDTDKKGNPGEEIAPAGTRSWQFPFTDFGAQVGKGCTAAFQCSWDPNTPNSWRKNLSQNAAQLYYFIGTFHDHLAAKPIGFTRAAGNFEARDGDAVSGQVLDGADTANGLPDPNHANNANMNTPPDGENPIMQMYLFYNPDPKTNNTDVPANSGDEADIVYHEYTHGLSNRLVVGADGKSTLGNVQAGSMGEAWSDFYAMDYLVGSGLETDTPAVGDVLVGKYVTGGHTIRTEGLDCPVGDTSEACPGTTPAGPGGYTYGDFGKVAGRPEVHADGEIWAQTLWDLRKAIGSRQAESLVTRGMELSPANPSFLDERNSILQADKVVNGGRLQKKIWQVFAHRGMGFFAGAVDGDDAQAVEDFSMPPAANTPRGSLTGKVTDKVTGAPLAFATVGFGGHASSFTDGFEAITAADGTYKIDGIFAATYPKVFAAIAGYDTQDQTVSIASRVNTVDWALRRDWASGRGGASVASFTGADYTADGCGPGQLIDQGQAGWVSDAEGTGPGQPDTTAIKPQSVVVKLPVAVNVDQLTINPATTCGLGGSASTGDYKLETSQDGTTWTLASQGHFTPAQRVPNTIAMAAGTTEKVQYVRYWMLGTQVKDLGGTCPDAFSGCDNVASTELAVYGTQVN